MSTLNRARKVDLLTLCDDTWLVVPENSDIANLIKLNIKYSGYGGNFTAEN